MNQNDGNNNGNGSAPKAPSFVSKASYIGTGVLIGLVIYPFVRKAITKLQPQMDKIFDDLTGKAENLAEKTSDLLARAKANLRKTDHEPDEHGDGHENEHGHSHRKEHHKSTVQ